VFAYVTEALSTGITLPTVILWLVIATGVYAKTRASSQLFRILVTVFLVMSVPIIPKLLFKPLDIGSLSVSEVAARDAQVIVIITSGSRSNFDVGYQDISNATEQRMAHAEKIAREFDLPMIASTTDKVEADLIADRYNKDVPVLVRVGGERTRDHISQISDILRKVEFSKAILVTTGSHAYRTKVVLEAKGFSISEVIVGEKDGDVSEGDLVPSFRGYLYWQIVLKEYWALGYYYLSGTL